MTLAPPLLPFPFDAIAILTFLTPPPRSVPDKDSCVAHQENLYSLV